MATEETRKNNKMDNSADISRVSPNSRTLSPHQWENAIKYFSPVMALSPRKIVRCTSTPRIVQTTFLLRPVAKCLRVRPTDLISALNRRDRDQSLRRCLYFSAFTSLTAAINTQRSTLRIHERRGKLLSPSCIYRVARSFLGFRYHFTIECDAVPESATARRVRWYRLPYGRGSDRNLVRTPPLTTRDSQLVTRHS